MQRVTLGNSGFEVSRLCLGTMTWGSQNTEAEAHLQADMALERGVTFWDTAEMYPTNPVRVETIGGTENIIGSWLARRGGRERIEIATKITGADNPNVRNGAAISGASLRRAVEQSLQRLGTDYIDLFQLHWPNRGSYHFRKIWGYVPGAQSREQVEAHMLEVLTEAQALIAEGKIRAIGVSNETVWGAALWLKLAERHNLPKMVSVQNEYSLLCRQFDSDWSELSVMENMPLLAYSPLATGLLSGKYAGDVTPEGSRRAATPDLGGRITPEVFPAVAAYLGIAAKHGIDPCQMAIAFCLSRPFPCIPIIGQTSTEQLKTLIDAADLVLSEALLADIAANYRAYPAPF